jgi:hypothetical protein
MRYAIRGHYDNTAKPGLVTGPHLEVVSARAKMAASCIPRHGFQRQVRGAQAMAKLQCERGNQSLGGMGEVETARSDPVDLTGPNHDLVLDISGKIRRGVDPR